MRMCIKIIFVCTVCVCPVSVVVVVVVREEVVQVGKVNLLPATLSTFLPYTSTVHVYVDYKCLNKN